MLDAVNWSAASALATVIAIDLTLAGDNAVVVGMAAAGLPPDSRRRAVTVGIAAAALLRVLFAVFTVQVLNIVGLTLAGGLLLLWVGWKLWREIANSSAAERDAGQDTPGGAKTFRQAVTQIVIADVSMSVDNVLAVAGAARDHMAVLVVGLGLSVVLMGVAASLVAALLLRYRWVAYLGLAMVLWVALRMIWDGSHQLLVTAVR